MCWKGQMWTGLRRNKIGKGLQGAGTREEIPQEEPGGGGTGKRRRGYSGSDFYVKRPRLAAGP